MTLTYEPYLLELRHPFTIAGFSRTATPLMLTRISHEGHTGYGEASMVPYMGENEVTAGEFLKKIDTDQFRYPFCFEEIMDYLDRLAPGLPAVKASIDIALHDLQGKLESRPCWQLMGSDPSQMPLTSYTVGIDSPDILKQKLAYAGDCRIIKVKLGRGNDRELINTIRSVTDAPLFVDANQGWSDRQASLEMAHWLKDQGVLLIEQPLAKGDPAANAWLSARSPVPIIADEAVQRFEDVERVAGAYNGINIKLMKSAGMHEAARMIRKARELGLKVLIGCMSETSCATLAGAALAPQCDWADLDGPLLVINNPFAAPDFSDGRWVLSGDAGLGLKNPLQK